MNAEEYEVVDAEFSPDDAPDVFDPLYKRVSITSQKSYVNYNWIEALDFAPDEMLEILHCAMIKENSNPTPENKIACYDIIKAISGEYWQTRREKHAKMIQEAQAA